MLKNKRKNFLLSLLIFIIIFTFDRASKMYVLNLAEADKYVDIYVNPFLNFHLIWNTGVGFGLFSSEENYYYNLITILIFLVNIIIIVLIFKSSNSSFFFFLMILAGSSGNLFDRVYYQAVPDFIDLHYINFHWFVFNVADIFITIGIACLIIVEFVFNNKKKLNNEKI